METVREFTYIGDRMSAGCEATVTAKKRYGWVMFMECDELLYCRRFPLKMQRAVYNQSMFFFQ